MTVNATYAGGKVCKIGGKWVVNPSGGLESKGSELIVIV